MIKLAVTVLATLISSAVFAQNAAVAQIFNERLEKFQNVRDICLSDDGKEVYFCIKSPHGEINQIVLQRKIGDGWTNPELLPFCDKYKYLEPFLADNGKRLYFVSDRPLTAATDTKKDFDIWYVSRESMDAPWSEPVNLGLPVNSANDEFYPTLSRNGNLYFTMVAPEGVGEDDIYVAEWSGTDFAKPKLLVGEVNTKGYEYNAFISPDESFLLFTRHDAPDGFGSGDLYISRRDKSGIWMQPKNLGGTVNTKYMEYCPFYDEKNKMLYFTSNRSSIQPKKFDSLTAMQMYITYGANGLSKLYRIPVIL